MTVSYTYGAVSGTTTLLDSTASSGDGGGADLKNLATAGYVMAPAITPTSAGPELYGGYMMLAKLQVAVSGVTAFKCWFVDSQDGTNYDSMSGTNVPTRAPDFVFVWPTVSSVGPFRMQSVPRQVARPPWKHKILVQNNSGQSTTNVNNDSQLIGVTYSELGT